MPADDLVLNVRQIAQYTPQGSAPTSASLLMQLAGIGSPYGSISPAALVGTALATGGNMAIGGQLAVQSVECGSGQFSNLATGLLDAQTISTVDFNAGFGSINGFPIATQNFVQSLIAGVRATSVWSVNGRTGDIALTVWDVSGAAPIHSPRFTGAPRAETPWPGSCDTRLATTAFVHGSIVQYINGCLKDHPFVFTFNGRTGDVVLTADDIIAAGGSGEIFNSPAFTGIPTAPTAPPGTNTTQLATTQFVMNAVAGGPFAPINSPVFTGTPSGPTAPPGSTTGQFATTAFVMNAVAESVTGVASFNTRTGNVTLQASDVTGAGGALLASPAFTGSPTAPTAAPGDNDTSIATTAFVQTAVAALAGGVTSFNTRTGAITLTSADISAASGALLASPIFTGTPAAPTAPFGTNNQQIATTAYVEAAILNGAVESFNGRTGNVTLTSADISAAGGAALQSPAFLGSPTAPTAAPGSNSTQLATTAFVTAAIGVGAGVTSFNSRTGAVVLNLADVTGVGGAPLNSPAFTGSPSAPTAAPGTSSTVLATTAFVANALASGAGVSSFNTRTGAVTLLGSDITAAGGAVLNSPAFTGSPTAPTATAGNSSTVIATTAFVQAAITAGAVASFNGRVGAITLNSADISAAGGALTASPTLTGTPRAPTPTAGDNSTLIATTAFVDTALAAAGGVNSFNGRAGAVTLTSADVAAVGVSSFNTRIGAVTLTAADVTAAVGAIPAASTLTPTMNGTAAIGTNGGWSRGDHVHPTDTSRYSASGGQINGNANVVGTFSSSGNFNVGASFSVTAANGNLSAAAATFGGAITATAGGVVYPQTGAGFAFGWGGGAPGSGITAFVNGGASQGMIVRSGTPQISTLTVVDQQGLNGTGPTMNWYYATGSVSVTVTFSDRRLKSNIRDAGDALSVIDQIKVHSLDLRNPLPGGSMRHFDYSLISDELDDTIPLARVRATGEDGSYESIDSYPLVCALIRAVQQLSGRLKTLEAKAA